MQENREGVREEITKEKKTWKNLLIFVKAGTFYEYESCLMKFE